MSQTLLCFFGVFFGASEGAGRIWEMCQTINEACLTQRQVISHSVFGYLVLLQQQMVDSTNLLAQLIYS